MNAVVQDGYGSPADVLSLRAIEVPGVGDEGVLVEVHAASVNALDWHATRGMPYVIRLAEGLRRPRQCVRGVDLAGRVAAVGRRATQFRVGDEVFGGGSGSFAEFTATTEDRLAHKPPGLTYEQAAALHVAGMTALQALRDKGRVQPGQSVLINGAGGGVGTCAVQIAKCLGARVSAVTRTESVALVASLGADAVFDYRTEDFTRRNERYDLVLDIGGNRPFAHLRRVVAPTGIILAVGAPAGRLLAPASRMAKAAALSPFVRPRLVPFISRNDRASLATLRDLAERHHISAVIDRQFSLHETPQAISYVGAGRARGKVVITIR